MPNCQTEVRTFLGLTDYPRRFCPDYASIARPQSAHSNRGYFKWGKEEQDAYDKLRKLFINAPVLAYPDLKTKFIPDTDASLDGIGAALSQVQGNEERPIAYYSKPWERNYCVTRRELLAGILAVKQFRPYFYGREFDLRTYHASLIWLYTRKDPAHHMVQWLETLAEFKFSIQHRAGHKHSNEYGMSKDCTERKKRHSIEQRDGGPTLNEISEDSTILFSQQTQVKDPLHEDIPGLQQLEGSETQI